MADNKKEEDSLILQELISGLTEKVKVMIEKVFHYLPAVIAVMLLLHMMKVV